MKITFFDTETTGMIKNWELSVTKDNLWNFPRIVSIAWITCTFEGDTSGAGMAIIKPKDYEIEKQAVEIHGITNDHANRVGLDGESVMSQFLTALIQSDAYCCHNTNFDRKIVQAEFLRYYGEVQPIFNTAKSFCTMQLSTKFCKIPNRRGRGYKWPKLQELHVKLFEKEFANAHGASADTKACKNAFFKLVELGVISLPTQLELSEIKP